MTSFADDAERARALGAELIRVHDDLRDELARVRPLVADARDRAAVLRELDGLTAVLESHLQWEERRLVSALDAGGWSAPPTAMFGT